MNEAIETDQTESEGNNARKRRPRVYDPLVDEALEQWAEYVRAFLLPRSGPIDLSLGTFFDDESLSPFSARARAGVSNPTLAAVLSDEDHLWAWPKSVHALIVDMPVLHRRALLGSALGVAQAVIAVQMNVSQQRVSFLICMARRSLGIALVLRIHVFNASRVIEQRKFG